MLFASAMQALHDGQKIRLSDWTGYWFKENETVMVQLKNGDTLDTPNIDRYQDRDDWQIVSTPGLGFDFAISVLKNNKCVYRLSNPHIYYKLMAIQSKYVEMVAFNTVTGGNSHAVLTAYDMIAEDWQVYNS